MSLLVLSLDTATDVATTCLSEEGVVLAEDASRGRSTAAQRLLADVHGLLERCGRRPADIGLIVAGTGPGTFTGLRIGLATAAGLGHAVGAPVRGVGTLAALLCEPTVEVACIDARRGEVFALGAGVPLDAYAPAQLEELLAPGAVAAGDGAVRYRAELAGAGIPPDDSPLHVPWARHHAALAATAGPPTPLYVRAPDADRVLAGRAAS